MADTTDHRAPQPTNRLIHEASPYLLQHAHNPVDWYPWGPDALERAKREDRPILLSIGYAACHWCHVMERESFENEEVAAFMNDHFISIKVDREERPDLDALYMDAVQALTGSGGWPMTVFLTPDGAPFYAGTYFPPADRYGMPAFSRVLASMADYYANHRETVEQQAQEFRDFYRRRAELKLAQPEVAMETEQPDTAALVAALDRLAAQFDAVNGGFGRAPKFPHPMGLEFVLRMLSRGDVDALDEEERARIQSLLTRTLDAMADGGIYDQIGGGFHRYSTDAYWLVPHFEKMLYDNAQLARVYLFGWQFQHEQRYRKICEETLEYILKEMTDPAGGFYSTQDADSEGVEGKFYVWTLEELRAALGETDAEIVADLWGVTNRGNFEGKNILHVARSPETVAAEHDLNVTALEALVASARERLYAARAQRVAPGRDDKVLAAWNGLMMRAFAEAGRIFQQPAYLSAARKNAEFIRNHLFRDDGLHRSWRQGTTGPSGYLEDYAALANGYLSLFEATGDAAHFIFARQIVDTAVDRFWDEEGGSFFDTARDAEPLIGRPRELMDNAVPSGTSLIAEALLRLGALTGDASYRARAERVLLSLAPAASEQPNAFSHFLCALDDLVGPLQEIALIGEPQRADMLALWRVLGDRYLPRAVFASASEKDVEHTAVPLLAGRGERDGQATAYVCEGFVCRQPVTSPGDLSGMLGS